MPYELLIEVPARVLIKRVVDAPDASEAIADGCANLQSLIGEKAEILSVTGDGFCQDCRQASATPASNESSATHDVCFYTAPQGRLVEKRQVKSYEEACALAQALRNDVSSPTHGYCEVFETRLGFRVLSVRALRGGWEVHAYTSQLSQTPTETHTWLTEEVARKVFTSLVREGKHHKLQLLDSTNRELLGRTVKTVVVEAE